MEKKFIAVRLNFTSPLHISRGASDYDRTLKTLHSDVIKSAIFVNALMLFHNELASEAQGKTFLESFKVSSAYPYYRLHHSDSKIDNSGLITEYFFPIPQHNISPFKIEEKDAKTGKKSAESDMQNRKVLKKITFAGQSLFEKLIKRKTAEILTLEKNNEIFAKSFASQNEHLVQWFQKYEKSHQFKIYDASSDQRVSIQPSAREFDADENGNIIMPPPEPYYIDKLYFQNRKLKVMSSDKAREQNEAEEETGLYFLLDIEDEKQLPKIKAALKLLQDSGLGTDRNIGNGHFKLDMNDEITLDVPDEAEFQTNLSLYCPYKEEIGNNGKLMQESFYDLIKRGGYLASPANPQHVSLRKKSIYMFTEGSIFPKQKLQGKTVNLQPDNTILADSEVLHPVWRDGKAIFLPMRSLEVK
ncbi:MAG: type III-A CRISPR-associated RAMP protein Csm4 [Bernardetiaceae bacterium]|nr:type III-A CRISPR-associated RAMP protein Csm4 [Bernardetiaceae bacterium]